MPVPVAPPDPAVGEALDDPRIRVHPVPPVPYYRWEQMKEEGDPFAASVLENHMPVTGVRL